MDPRNRKVVEIHWVDSAGWNGWNSPDGIDKRPSLIRSVGILIEENDEGIVFASCASSTGNFWSPTIVPWCAIIGYWVLTC